MWSGSIISHIPSDRHRFSSDLYQDEKVYWSTNMVMAVGSRRVESDMSWLSSAVIGGGSENVVVNPCMTILEYGKL